MPCLLATTEGSKYLPRTNTVSTRLRKELPCSGASPVPAPVSAALCPLHIGFLVPLIQETGLWAGTGGLLGTSYQTVTPTCMTYTSMLA